MPNTIRKMSGCPVRQVRHIYKNRGLITNYSIIGGICKICPPPPPTPPPRPPANIEFRVFSATPYSVTFELGLGSGTYDLGDGVLIPFSALVLPVTITGVVPVGGTVRIYSNDLEGFKTTDQPVSYLDVSNCPTLTSLLCNQTNPGQSYLSGVFDISANPNLLGVQFTNTLISNLTGSAFCPQMGLIDLTGANFSQLTADELVNDIFNSTATFGALLLTNQVGGTIDITGFLYTNLINTYGWDIYN
jgi:hypothetical protein